MDETLFERAPPFPSLAGAIQAFDVQTFVGRERELAIFREWLDGDPQPFKILQVCGPGGVGKSALLRLFQRTAQQLGRPVILIDGRDLRPTEEDFLQAFRSRGIDAQGRHPDAPAPVILIDAFELLADLTHFLQAEFLPGLGDRTRLVLAGRHHLGLAWGRWLGIIHSLELHAFSPAVSRTYLARRSVPDPHLVEQLVQATGGHPLALSLAADMVLQLGARAVGGPTWHLITHSVVEQLLRDVPDAALRQLLEACAVVRQFDESTLGAIAGSEISTASFDQLCRLTLVRPAQHGLMLHDDVQRILADDLRWRHAERYNTLRLRALEYYRKRARLAAPAEREWLLHEQHALWENAFVQALVYTEGEAGEVWLEAGSPVHLAEVRDVWWYWVDHALSSEVRLRPNLDRVLVDQSLAAMVQHPAARLVLARDRDGRAVGFVLSLPICGETLPLLENDFYYGPLVRAYWTPSERAHLPAGGSAATAHYLLFLAHTDDHSEATRAALLRESFSLFALAGTYLCCTPIPAYKRLFESLGFDLVISNAEHFWGDEESEDGFVLNLAGYGVERWVAAIMSGRRLAPAPRAAEVAALLQSALVHWYDDQWLQRSPLVAYLADRHGEVQTASGGEPAAFRAAVSGALQSLRVRAPSNHAVAYQALELAYLHKHASHEHLAESLAVSRSTFYRLVNRALRDLASELAISATDVGPALDLIGPKAPRI